MSFLVDPLGDFVVGSPRVRFAPSPTGYFHVGSARTALFNWLFARRTGGTFILRIEDTDQERNREEWVEGIVSAMSWLGMDADEGPYRQSERRDRHSEAVESLWDGGHLYACDCTREEIDERIKGATKPGYDGFCRDRQLERESGVALRFRVPDSGTTVVADLVRGPVEFPNDAIEDFILVKSSGQPLFVLANVVDDIDMGISHVIRGEDLLPTTPKAILIWEALCGDDKPLPVFAHLPMLVNEQRKKLSKRRDPVAVEMYRDEGYLADAFVNYLALLGWSDPSGEEMLSRSSMIESFRLENVNHSPAFFDVAKLRHMNGEYVRAMSTAVFVDACGPWLTGAGAPWPSDRFDIGKFESIAPLVQERVSLLGEVPAMVDFLFLEDLELDSAALDGVISDVGAKEILVEADQAYAEAEWSTASLHQATVDVADRVGRKLGKAQMPIRVAVTGRKVGPPLFESMALLTRAEVRRRIGLLSSRL